MSDHPCMKGVSDSEKDRKELEEEQGRDEQERLDRQRDGAELEPPHFAPPPPPNPPREDFSNLNPFLGLQFGLKQQATSSTGHAEDAINGDGPEQQQQLSPLHESVQGHIGDFEQHPPTPSALALLVSGDAVKVAATSQKDVESSPPSASTTSTHLATVPPPSSQSLTPLQDSDSASWVLAGGDTYLEGEDVGLHRVFPQHSGYQYEDQLLDFSSVDDESLEVNRQHNTGTAGSMPHLPAPPPPTSADPSPESQQASSLDSWDTSFTNSHPPSSADEGLQDNGYMAIPYLGHNEVGRESYPETRTADSTHEVFPPPQNSLVSTAAQSSQLSVFYQDVSSAGNSHDDGHTATEFAVYSIPQAGEYEESLAGPTPQFPAIWSQTSLPSTAEFSQVAPQPNFENPIPTQAPARSEVVDSSYDSEYSTHGMTAVGYGQIEEATPLNYGYSEGMTQSASSYDAHSSNSTSPPHSRYFPFSSTGQYIPPISEFPPPTHAHYPYESTGTTTAIEGLQQGPNHGHTKGVFIPPPHRVQRREELSPVNALAPQYGEVRAKQKNTLDSAPASRLNSSRRSLVEHDQAPLQSKSPSWATGFEQWSIQPVQSATIARQYRHSQEYHSAMNNRSSSELAAALGNNPQDSWRPPASSQSATNQAPQSSVNPRGDGGHGRHDNPLFRGPLIRGGSLEAHQSSEASIAKQSALLNRKRRLDELDQPGASASSSSSSVKRQRGLTIAQPELSPATFGDIGPFGSQPPQAYGGSSFYSPPPPSGQDPGPGHPRFI